MLALRAVSTSRASGYLIEAGAHSLAGGVERKEPLNLWLGSFRPSASGIRVFVDVSHVSGGLVD